MVKLTMIDFGIVLMIIALFVAIAAALVYVYLPHEKLTGYRIEL